MASKSDDNSQNASGRKENDETWTHGLFACHENWRQCVGTFCCPCYTIGRNATYFNEDGVLICGLYLMGCGLGFGPVLRWRTREAKKVQGSMVEDVMAHFLCPCCALIQENKELYGLQGKHIGEKIPLKQDMSRE